MSKVSVEEAILNLKAFLEQVAAGEEIVIVDRDKPVTRLVPPSIEEEVFADMRQFRESLSVKGESLSQTVIRARQEERY
ncbi:MAG: type II toxin-antitoxin system Phd/YefM family antitoxin [Xenococcaceae cyanobacterium MO_188.B29]|nr:type II toxin-antitoxin system Phd/YefM family antitoxin [Xenococcaceae cyanobacterium MO_188.B29]